MSGRLLDLLIQMSLTTSIAVIFVAVVRKPLRALAGTRNSYVLWVAVPTTALAMIASHFLPTPSMPVLAPSLRAPLQNAFTNSIARASLHPATHYSVITLSAWFAGVVVMLALLAYRHRCFMRSLGHTHLDVEGMLRSDRIVTPMLVGAWRPLVLIPANFEALYSAEDRALMLAHERAHRDRGDALANVFAAGWLCIFWFNPLMYWAVARFRFDQELACDASVLSRTHVDKQHYANALLKAQFKSESVWPTQIGCHWRSTHPLKERISMLKHASQAGFRRIGGTLLTIGLIAGFGCISAGFAESPNNSASIADGGSTEKKMMVDAQDMNTRDVLEMIAHKSNQNVLVSDKVTGKITVHLRDVTYREALHIVALSQGLVTKQDGTLTIIDVLP